METAAHDSSYVGGLRWRGWNWTKPLATLTITDTGIVARTRFSFMKRLQTSWSWAQDHRVQPVRGAIPIPSNVGVAFYGPGRLVFWSSVGDRDRIIEDVRRRSPSTQVLAARVWVF
jgi:hypothetical protein